VKILFVGEINGKPGRRVAAELIPRIKKKWNINFVITNGENVAGGFGLTENLAKKLQKYGVDCITSGNHFWDKKDEVEEIASLPYVLRPANYSQKLKIGKGVRVFSNKIGVINLVGREYFRAVDCPFTTALREVERLGVRIIIIDFHAESQAEKQALAYYLKGKVTAVIGTHTHVQTRDEKILKGGTAYITDVGMTGIIDSVIGVVPRRSINYFVKGTPERFDSADGKVCFNAVIINVNEETGEAISIHRISQVI
jgi:hypothetical protein